MLRRRPDSQLSSRGNAVTVKQITLYAVHILPFNLTYPQPLNLQCCLFSVVQRMRAAVLPIEVYCIHPLNSLKSVHQICRMLN